MHAPATPAHLAKGKAAESTDLIVSRRFELVTRLAPPRRGTLLDFGCGSGAQTLLFVPHFDRTIAADVDEPYLNALARRAQEASASETVQPICYDGGELPLRSASIDYAVSFEVLEHVHDEVLALAELHRVLKPGATMSMSVPNRWWIFETHGAALPLLPWNRVPFFSWLPKRWHDRWARARIYSRREIVRKFGAAGFEVQSAVYITAPMDVVRNPRLQRWLRALVFRGSVTRVPFLSTAVLVVATRR